MTISYREERTQTCPHCNATYRIEVWLILDAQEQPAEVEMVQQTQANQLLCPHCGGKHQARAPLLLHHAAIPCVLFAPAPDSAEHSWRDQARTLLQLLVERLPPHQRHPYLGEVQLAQDVAGMARLLRRMQQRQARTPDTVADQPHQPAAPTAAPTAETRKQVAPARPADRSPTVHSHTLWNAVQTLLGADSPQEFRALVGEYYPFLLEPESDLALRHMADALFEQRQYELADHVSSLRQFIQELRSGPTGLSAQAEPATDAPPGHPAQPPATLPAAAYAALLRAQTTAAMLEATQEHTVLLEPWVNDCLLACIDQAVDDGYEHLAIVLEQRREVLFELRQPVENGIGYAETNTSV
jgi:hypothetical protein